MLIVQKFGGSSLADVERLRRAAEICRAARNGEHDLIVVVSAMGDTTDDLAELAHEINPDPPERELDALLTTGEQQSAALLAMTLESIGIKARSFTGWQAGIITDASHGNARIALITASRLRAALRSGTVAVVSGFQGLDPAGDITSLGRGGSDTTAVALAAALNAGSCRIYSDVDGIYTADPRLVTGAKLLSSIDYTDMLRLATAGSQVLHCRAVELAMTHGVEIELYSTFTGKGGSVVRHLSDEQRRKYAGVTRNTARSEVCVVGKGADASTLSNLTMTLAGEGIPVLGADISEGTVRMKVPEDMLLHALDLTHTALMLQ